MYQAICAAGPLFLPAIGNGKGLSQKHSLNESITKDNYIRMQLLDLSDLKKLRHNIFELLIGSLKIVVNWRETFK